MLDKIANPTKFNLCWHNNDNNLQLFMEVEKDKNLIY
jgi:hypothetical protein